jgi:phosphopantothenoylcysteine decarboxylase/phosphopantothenate--cysteine ligase
MSSEDPRRLEGEDIVLAVTGSIAAYKACEVLRRLQDAGADVRVVMTRNAAEFVSPLTFAALSGHRVISGSFEDPKPERLSHIRWAKSCSAFCVVPASADFLAKMALGIADDFPSSLHLAVEAPVLVAPAMEAQMWAHPAVQRNVDILNDRGVTIVEPGVGHLASGGQGPGRLAEPAEIVAAIAAMVNDSAGPPARGSLAGQRVLVSAGPTREHLDPARMLSNPSSGKMGYALAREARDRGAEVVLVSGPTALPDPAGVEVVRVVSVAEMADAMMSHVEQVDVVVMAAAPADFRPAQPSPDKIKKAGADKLTLELVATPDILALMRDAPGARLVIGFAAETGDLELAAREKLRRKGCDLIVANRVGLPGAGFESDLNEVMILDRLDGRIEVGPAPKSQVAAAIWDAAQDFRGRVAAESSGQQA